jgi:hypothetical protein
MPKPKPQTPDPVAFQALSYEALLLQLHYMPRSPSEGVDPVKSAQGIKAILLRSQHKQKRTPGSESAYRLTT